MPTVLKITLGLSLALSALAPVAVPVAAQSAPPVSPPGETVILDASAFIDEIQKGHVLTDAASLDVPWVFNNTALEMRTRSNYVIRAQIPSAGRYYLYARTHGGDRSSPGYSAHAFDHTGQELWSWEAPAEGERLRAEFEAPGVLWDLDGDGAPRRRSTGGRRGRRSGWWRRTAARGR